LKFDAWSVSGAWSLIFGVWASAIASGTEPAIFEAPR
jgi:hypothetical protein